MGIGAVVAGLAAFFASNVAIAGSVSGLSLTAAISMTSLLQWCVRSFSQLEAAMNSCERILYYTESIPQEAPWTSAELESYANEKNEASSSPGTAVLAVRACGG